MIALSHVVVAVSVAVFVLLTILDVTGAYSRHQIYSICGLSYHGVFHRGLVFEFLTYPFIHTSVVHLLFNMFTVWTLGPHVERSLGKFGYAGMSLVAAFSGAMAFLFVDWEGRNIALGFSAVIFGLLMAQVLFHPEQTIILLFWPMRAKHAVLVMGAVELYLAVNSENGGLSSVTHLFGALGAFLFVSTRLWFQRQKRKRHPLDQSACRHYRQRFRIPKDL